MAISNSRLQELIAHYNGVKAKAEDVDRKYSMDYQEPSLDMPESLGLTKLIYEPKSEEELRELAEVRIAASYLSKQRQLDSTYVKSLQSIDNRVFSLAEETRVKLWNLLNDYNQTCEKLFVRLVDNGLRFSSVLTRANDEARADYNSSIEEQNARAENKRDRIEADRRYAEENYASACRSLEEERQAKIQQTYNKLLDDETKQKRSADKYNTSIDEKETKYQATRARAYESARQAEYSRAYAAAKLYAQLGATGYAERIQWEKYRLFQEGFAFMTKEEAMTLLEMDSFARTHLLDYYSTLVDWIKRNLA